VTGDAEAILSDERQGLIIAGKHTGTAMCGPVGGPSCPHYADWLATRISANPTNRQIVAVIDTGYDDGTFPGDHHPDLESPDRLQGWGAYDAQFNDRYGHGTMVAGIIAGRKDTPAPVPPNANTALDAAGFEYGTGIAPFAQVYPFKVGNHLLPDGTAYLDRDQRALNSSRMRVETDRSHRAFVANESWNLARPAAGGTFGPEPNYTSFAQFFDARVIDASAPRVPSDGNDVAGAQPMTIVFSAGNHANGVGCPSGASVSNSVSSPAVAKNVIAVGATENIRPATSPPNQPAVEPANECRQCSGGRPPNHDAVNANAVASFSGRGKDFGAYPATDRANTIRIKPDLVAPGVRVFSTVPYATENDPGNTYSNQPATEVNGCAKYWPLVAPHVYHTFGTGTSFAAPVVSGAAAVVRQWFTEHTLADAPPSLVKAALIATADDLGTAAGTDHRPSPIFGWGRVNLDRAIDSTVPRWWAAANASNSVTTGGMKTFNRTVFSAVRPVLIVLVWDDPPSKVVTTSQAPLQSQLSLSVGGGLYRGNAFNENITGLAAEDGYSYRFRFGQLFDDTINNVEAVLIPPGGLFPGPDHWHLRAR
jgi:subtilisin family serine protease